MKLRQACTVLEFKKELTGIPVTICISELSSYPA